MRGRIKCHLIGSTFEASVSFNKQTFKIFWSIYIPCVPREEMALFPLTNMQREDCAGGRLGSCAG